jgi:membrane protease YdiL (CAAX protease family)
MFPHTDEVALSGWLHVGYFGALIPALTVLYRKKALEAQNPLPDRLTWFRKWAKQLLLFATISLVVGLAQEIVLFPRTLPPLPAVAAGAAAYVAAVAFMWPRWRRDVQRRERSVYFFMVTNPVERSWWIIISVLAGVGEEITWRGVQTALVAAISGSYLVAVAVCSLTFGLGHVTQGWRSAAIVGLFALGLHTLVWLGESLYVAMAVHFAYDLTAGMTLGRLGKVHGYTPAEPEKPGGRAELLDQRM